LGKTLSQKIIFINYPSVEIVLPEGWSSEKISLPLDVSKSEFFQAIDEDALVCLSGPLSYRVGQWLTVRSMNCREGDYVDLLIPSNNGWFGESLQSLVFKDILVSWLKKLKTIDDVLFLGIDERVITLIPLIHSLGGRKFYFFDSGNITEQLKKRVEEACAKLIRCESQFVKERAFLRDVKIYKVAIVSADFLGPEQVEDFSYFHFLRGDSLLIEGSPIKGFPFSVAESLGIPVVYFKDISVLISQQLSRCL